MAGDEGDMVSESIGELSSIMDDIGWSKVEAVTANTFVIIQPYWRSIYRHHKPNIVGAGMHPTFEIHVSKLGYASEVLTV